MSRREKEGRDSYSRRLHSRPWRDQSPNKSRRDGKQATEKTYSSSHRLDVETLDWDHKKRRRLQDASPLEIPSRTETKMQFEMVMQGLEKKVDGISDAAKHSSQLRETPRSQSYFQHDERGSAGNGGRGLDHRPTDHRRDRDPNRERFRDKVEHQSLPDQGKVWRHDGFFELETAAPPARRRPAFRENKIEAPPQTARGSENKYGRQVPRGGGGGYVPRGRDGFEGRFGDGGTHRPGGGGFRVEKWKHDLFDEANRSPRARNEEEDIAKVEALLAL